MKKQLLLSILILMSLINFQQPISAKIQINDTWEYIDNKDIRHNETAISNVQINSGNTVISSMLVNTTRGFAFPYNYNKVAKIEGWNYSVIFDLIPNITALYVTQESGISLYPEGSLTGSIMATINDEVREVEIKDSTFLMRRGDPALAIVSTTSEKYIIETQFEINDIGFDPAIIVYIEEYVVSTNDDFESKVKNYTFTKNCVHVNLLLVDDKGEFSIMYTECQSGVFSYRIVFNEEFIQGETTPIHLSALDEPTMLMTFDDEHNIPIFIRQTEPATVINGLHLNGLEVVEYTLVIDNIETSSKSDSYYPFFFMVITLPLIIKRKFF